MKEYRLIESFGHYMNKRWEVQKKYFYYENGNKIESWYTVFHSKDKKLCEDVLKKYKTKPIKNYKQPFIEW